MTPGDWIGLLFWGTLVGLDLVSLGQTMVSRPLVAGTVAGLIQGDLATGATVGVLLELFALDLLPVGAARYPDYGAATVAATAVAAGSPGPLALGLAIALALATAYLGQWSIYWVRRWNQRDIQRNRGATELGDPRTIAWVHWRSLLRDALRSSLLIVVALAAAQILRSQGPSLVTLGGALLLSAAAAGAALGVGATGALHLASSRLGRWLFAAGLLGGGTWAVLG